MKYVGNYKSWLDENQHLIDMMMGTSVGERNGTYHDDEIERMKGDRRPAPPTQEDLYNETLDLAKMWYGAGYDLNKISWEMFYQSHLGKFKPPLPIPKGQYEHWFCKMSPGDLLPMHDDRFQGKSLKEMNSEGINITRYWMACQDAQHGHVFAYKDTLLTGYKAGDMFVFDRADDLHGSCNVGFVPKLSYQLTVIEPRQE